MMSVEELAELLLPRLIEAGYVSDTLTQIEKDYLHEVTALIHDRIVLLKEAADMLIFLL